MRRKVQSRMRRKEQGERIKLKPRGFNTQSVVRCCYHVIFITIRWLLLFAMSQSWATRNVDQWEQAGSYNFRFHSTRAHLFLSYHLSLSESEIGTYSTYLKQYNDYAPTPDSISIIVNNVLFYELGEKHQIEKKMSLTDHITEIAPCVRTYFWVTI